MSIADVVIPGTVSSGLSEAVKQASPELTALSDRVRRVANEYVDLCSRYAVGASDPDLIEVLAFSEREVHLLSEFTPEEIASYHKVCEMLVNSKCPSIQRLAAEDAQVRSVSQFKAEVNVPGDGNCGLHAFARSYVASMDDTDANRLKGVIQKQIAQGQIRETSDEKTVLDRLEQGTYSSDDAEFMAALPKVLRKIGHNAIPEYYRTKINEMGNSQEVRSIMANLIPEKDGVWVDHEGLIALGRILGKKICVVRNREGEKPVLVEDKMNPDMVIGHRHSHFTSYLK